LTDYFTAIKYFNLATLMINVRLFLSV